MIDSLKAQRTAKLQGLRMNWKLHKVIEQTVVCAREQEIFKKDEQVGQMAVRFVTEQVRLNPHVLCLNLLLIGFEGLQSLEIRDARGRIVGSGSHENPERVTEVKPLSPDTFGYILTCLFVFST